MLTSPLFDGRLDMRDPMIRILKGLDLFVGASRRQLQSVVNLGTFVDVPAGRVVCRQGVAAREFFVVVEGRVELERAGATVAILLEGEAWGEPRRIDDACCHAATATATSRTCLLVYTRREYLALLERCPSIAERLSEAARLDVPVMLGPSGLVGRAEERWLAPSPNALIRSQPSRV
jgi:CRP-like cAMP-binding protein